MILPREKTQLSPEKRTESSQFLPGLNPGKGHTWGQAERKPAKEEDWLGVRGRKGDKRQEQVWRKRQIWVRCKDSPDAAMLRTLWRPPGASGVKWGRPTWFWLEQVAMWHVSEAAHGKNLSVCFRASSGRTMGDCNRWKPERMWQKWQGKESSSSEPLGPEQRKQGTGLGLSRISSDSRRFFKYLWHWASSSLKI